MLGARLTWQENASEKNQITHCHTRNAAENARKRIEHIRPWVKINIVIFILKNSKQKIFHIDVFCYLVPPHFLSPLSWIDCWCIFDFWKPIKTPIFYQKFSHSSSFIFQARRNILIICWTNLCLNSNSSYSSLNFKHIKNFIRKILLVDQIAAENKVVEKIQLKMLLKIFIALAFVTVCLCVSQPRIENTKVHGCVEDDKCGDVCGYNGINLFPGKMILVL